MEHTDKPSHKKVLIVSFTFPPTPGIGGRRWYKFAKLLWQMGHQVQVIAAKPQRLKQPGWSQDESFDFSVDYLSAGYPAHLGVSPDTIFEKIMYRLSLLYAKIMVRGNYYDKSAYWRSSLINAVSSKINQGFDHVVVTCAPFRSSFFLTELIDAYPEVRWTVDFRDPWTDNQTAYGFEGLHDIRKKQEQDMEKKVLKKFNQVLTVAEPITERFKGFDHNAHFATIHNGFDEDDFAHIPGRPKHQDSLSFVYAGTLYQRSTEALEVLLKMLEKEAVQTQLKNSNASFTFIGCEHPRLQEMSLSHPFIKLLPRMSSEEAVNRINESAVGMLFLTPDIDYSFSTKFSDYMALRKPVAVFSGKNSRTGTYVEEQGIGYNIHDMAKENFLQVLKDWESRQMPVVGDNVRNQFDLKRLTEKMAKLI